MSMTARAQVRRQDTPPARGEEWTFLTNHAHVLICLADDPQMRVREVARRVGITERAVLKIIAELEAAGALRRIRSGRRNRYCILPQHRLHHPVERHCRVRDLLNMVLKTTDS